MQTEHGRAALHPFTVEILMPQTIVLASNNEGKLREFRSLLAPLGCEVRPQGEFTVPEIEEPHCTFVENALEKARHAALFTGLPALADDTGVCVNALGGAPGVLSARYAGEPNSDARNNDKLIAELASHADKSAFYYCVLVFVRHAQDPQPLIAEGRWDGIITDAPHVQGGFGYHSYFWIPGMQKTAAGSIAAFRVAAAGVICAFSVVRAQMPLLRFQFA